MLIEKFADIWVVDRQCSAGFHLFEMWIWVCICASAPHTSADCSTHKTALTMLTETEALSMLRDAISRVWGRGLELWPVVKWLCKLSELSCMCTLELVFLTTCSFVPLVTEAQYSNEPFLSSHTARGSGECVRVFIFICMSVCELKKGNTLVLSLFIQLQNESHALFLHLNASLEQRSKWEHRDSWAEEMWTTHYYFISFLIWDELGLSAHTSLG